ncbi:ricin-type beta-trefoil lectin domain protein [Kitasatospora sp. NPDC048365]|uniref:ricin-type beta-trefoil lectin domain protein n=1 Tax=Kitasatospora sp. NPDC048365 TaxID=3364050 RepID=UPI0037168BDE
MHSARSWFGARPRGGGSPRGPLVAALTVALALLVPLAGEGLAVSAQAAGKDRKVELPQLPRVSGHDAGGRGDAKPLPHPAGARELTGSRPAAAKWPGRATVAVDLNAKGALKDAPVRAGSTPVLLGRISPDQVGAQARAAAGAKTISAPSAVEVQVADRAQAQQAGVAGLLVALKRTDGERAAAGVAVSLDYGAVADAFGGGWASRLRLVAMPACALTSPEKAECRTRRPLESSVDAAARRITATVALPGEGSGLKLDSAAGSGMALAAEAGTEGSQGSYTATDLSASGTWAQSANGAFTYAYPIAVPPSVAGNPPSVGLSYDSQSVDGKTSARNAQASWIGDGWSYSPGFIERSYRPCRWDGVAGSADQCWAGWNATLSLGSHSGELVRGGDGVYHLQNDDGTRVERLTGAANGLWQGEYFKVTTADGTAYYLGLNHTPGTTAGDATNSAWGMPVLHPGDGDPCHTAAGAKKSQCDRQPGWRFNLDFVVDPHGNVQRYDWAAEANRYAQADTGLTPYTRGGELARISYGYRLADAQAGREPTARVWFDVTERCTVSEEACKPQNLSAATAANWPDVPYDLACQDGWATSGTGANVCRTASPTFWSTKRLAAVRTELRTEGGWHAVDHYALTQVFSAAGGSYDPVTGNTPHPEATGSLQSVMWLSQIRRTAQDTTAGSGETVALDPVEFAGTELDNRVDASPTGAPPLYRPRIIGVRTESGTSIAVTYRDPECSRMAGRMPAAADRNTMACYPAYWTPPLGAEPVADWFHKTLVAKVTVSDTTKANSPPRVTAYDYAGAAWHRDDSELTDDKYRTWNDFRGFRTVTTTSGAGPDPVRRTTTGSFQGMEGDYLADRTTLRTVPKVENSLGEKTPDRPWLAGIAQETATYGDSGVIAKQLAEEPATEVTASRPRTAWTSEQPTAQNPAPKVSTLPALEARRITASTQRSLALLSDGRTWRESRTATAFDAAARPVTVDTRPDTASGADRSCVRTEYAAAPAANPMMLSYPSRILTLGGDCATTPAADTTVSDRRLVYDGAADPANPGTVGTLGQNGTSLGLVTATQSLKAYDAQGNPVYQTLGALAADELGRTVRSVDAAGAASTIAYSPASGTLPTGITTTNPLGWTSRTTVAPARGLVTRSVDANGRVTDSTFDALGRRTAAWLPGNNRDDGRKADQTFTYRLRGVDPDVKQQADPPSVTTLTQRENGTWSTSVTIYDGFLAERQTQSTTANAADGRVVASTHYDSLGRPSKTTAAWSDPTTGPNATLFEETDNTVPSQTRYVYDGAGRTVASVLYAKATELWRTTTAYPGAERTDTTPPSGGTPATEFTDALGRTTASVLHGGPGSGDVTTRYGYDRRGKPSTIADNAGNTWTFGYDVRGNRVSVSDPNAGTSGTRYDDLGRVASTTDPLGKVLSYSYDVLGRTTSRYEGADPSDRSKLLASWTYDTLAKGLPTSTTRYVGGESGSAYVQKVDGYNTRYQPTSTTTSVPAAEGRLAGDWTRSAFYTDNLGLLAGYGYRAEGGLPAETLGFGRDLQGEITSTGTDSTRLMDSANYNPLGQLLLAQYGTRGDLLRTARTYDDTTGRVTTRSVSLQQSDANPVSATTYGYNQLGGLTSSSELQSSGSTDQAFDTQCYRYDGLGRLTEAWTDTWGVTGPGAGQVSHCANDNPSWVSLGGPAPYWHSYQYNLLGDRTQQVRHDVGGDTSRDVTQTTAYAGDGRTPAARPNTATAVTTRTGAPTATLASALAAADGSRMCLDVRGGRTADGTSVETWSCNGTPAQRWTRPGDGTLRALGKCVQPVGGTGGGGTAVELATCDGSPAQKWQDGADGALVHTASSLCLEIPGWNQQPGTQAGLWWCTGYPNQQWPATADAPTGPSFTTTLTPQYDTAGNTTSRATATTGTLPSAVATGTTPLCLDAVGGSSANGTAVQTWTCNGTPAQEWTLGTDGTLRVLGACARPAGGNGGGGAQLELWACDTADGSQQWRTGSDGALVHKASGQCVDIPWASGTPGTRVMLYACNHGPNQTWGPVGAGGTAKPTAGANQVFAYNAEGRTESVVTPDGGTTVTSRYLYDADGELLLQRGPEGTILYLFGGAEQLTLSPDGTTVSGNRYYHQPDGTAIIRSGLGNLSYQFTDPQNTATLQVDPTTRAVTRRPVDPYGTPRGTTPTAWADNRGYLNRPTDTGSGLALLGARTYDPALGRFLTVDPLLAAGNPDQMGGYTYSSNDPVNRSDPSGLIDGDCWEGRCSGHYKGSAPADLNVVDRNFFVEQAHSTEPIQLKGGLAVSPDMPNVGEFLKRWRDKKFKEDKRNHGEEVPNSYYNHLAVQACEEIRCEKFLQLTKDLEAALVEDGEIGVFGHDGGGKPAGGPPKAGGSKPRASNPKGEGPKNNVVADPNGKLPQLRIDYIKEVEALKKLGEEMRQKGHTPEEIARTLQQLRRDIGVKYKDLTPEAKRQEIYERNMKRYGGDPLGPTVDWLRNEGKSWEQIIEGASRSGGKDLGLEKR